MGTPAIYSSETTSMAILETLVHFNVDGLPLNRYLVRIDVPDAAWAAATVWPVAGLAVAWDALPCGRDSMNAGNEWLMAAAMPLLLVVPSVIVPHECNVLINPKHADAGTVSYKKLRKWIYDPRLLKA